MSRFKTTYAVRPYMTLAVLASAVGMFLAGPLRIYGASADRVVILANGSDPDSLAIAVHYANARHVPRGNIVSFPMPMVETISWKEFVSTIWQPVKDDLVRRHLIDAIPMDLYDEVGRRKYAVSGHAIDAIVICRGVPLRIANDPDLLKGIPEFGEHPELRTNEGAVDSELSLLAQSEYPVTSFVRNPLFQLEHPDDAMLSQVIKVSRLDGPTVAQAMGLVDLAMKAERDGLVGRAYVDIAGPHALGNRWLEAVAMTVRSMGFDTSISHGPSVLSEGDRFDAPALYFGWYTENISGPFLMPGFKFPPGAIAVHIHSYSARTLRSESLGWCGPLVARGVTATVGNVWEPYLESLHRPDLLIEALGRGDNLAEAAYYALPSLSWQSIVIGDPLYCPFPKGRADRPDPSRAPAALAPYAILRQMNILEIQGKPSDAVVLGQEGLRTNPNLALALGVAERLGSQGDRDGAVWTLRKATDSIEIGLADTPLMVEIAAFLSALGRSEEALEVYRKAFSVDSIPPSVRAVWLSQARVVALRAGSPSEAAEWKQEMDELAEQPGSK